MCKYMADHSLLIVDAPLKLIRKYKYIWTHINTIICNTDNIFSILAYFSTCKMSRNLS